MTKASKERKYLSVRWAAFIDCLWIMSLATIIFLFDGLYPADYLTWMGIIGIFGALMPWCFIDVRSLP